MKSRLFWILAIGLLLAVLLLAAVQVTSVLGQVASTDDVAITPVKTEADTGITPVIFRIVNEYGPIGEKILRMNGTSEPNAVLIVLNKNERLRQIKANAEGNWALDIAVTPAEIMVIEIVMFVEGGLNVRGEETVLRIPVPKVVGKNEETDLETDTRAALIMVTAPGGPTRIVQTPFGGSPTDGPLTMGPIDYDDSGGVIFSGTTEEEGRVRIFAGPQQIGETRVGAGGRWNFIAGGLLPLGEYEIAAELVKTEGVAARVSVPYERLPPSLNAEQTPIPDVRYEPFHWQVRRPLLGGGSQYTAIFAPQEADALIVEE